MRNYLLFAGLLFFLGCSGVSINSSRDPKADFSSYKSFCWIDGCEANYSGPVAPGQREKMLVLQEVIKEVLQEKGYVNDSIAPDLLVGFRVTIKEKEVLINRVDDGPNSPYETEITYWRGYESYYDEEIQRFLKGTLVIDIIDGDEGRAVWQGIAERYMEIDPKINRDKMKKAVEKIFKDFPPPN